MKPPVLALLAALAVATAGPAGSGHRFGPRRALHRLSAPDYKKPQVLPDTFFNPFKVQAEAGPAKKDGPGVAAESVAAAITLRHVTGIAYAPTGGVNRAIIGDEVFGIGDEVSFADSDKPGLTPLLPGNTVVLREVDAGHLAFDVGAEGETPRRVSFSLRNFWTP